MRPLLAKSDETTLEAHTRHVVTAMDAMIEGFLPQLSLSERLICHHGAILHDLGKGHPFFQEALLPGFDPNRYKHEYPHRHEISSLLFLPLFEKSEWSILIDLVVGHHKSVRHSTSESKGRGFLDLIDKDGFETVLERHLANWDIWHLKLEPILRAFEIPWRVISISEASEALDYCYDYLSPVRMGRNQWRGLLMAADHLASALQEDTEFRMEKLFALPDLSKFEERSQKI